SGTGKSVQRRRIVICIITTLYIAYLLQFIGQWYMLKITVVDQGITRGKLFIAVARSPGWGNLLNNITSFILSSLADILLIWRCFHVWDDSVRVILLPLMVLVVQIGELDRHMYSTNKICSAKSDANIYNTQRAQILNEFIAAGMFTTFACTLFTTLLIIYRIYPVTYREGGFSNTTQRFKFILDILIQSAALHSLTSLAYAIASVLPLDNTDNAALLSTQIYSSSLFFFIAGAAPTVMVARIALSTTENPIVSKLTHISGLEFHGQSTTPDHTQSYHNIGSSGSFTQDVEKAASASRKKRPNLFVIVKVSVKHLDPSRYQARILDNIFSLGMIPTFVCTLTTTILIIRRFYHMVHQEGHLRSAT
ncbi:hypothetical protein CVT25_015682, partial [Psilocybe cyanescens]